MKKLVFWLVFLLLISGVCWYYSVPQNIEAFVLQTPCDAPVQYHLGSVDPRFGLSNAQVLDDISQATSLWSTYEGKSLFVYNPKGNLTVSLIYDERQQLSTQISSMTQSVTGEKGSLAARIATYEQQVTQHQQKLAAFEQQVSNLNNEGGAPPDLYAQLKQQQDSLNNEALQLNAQGQSLRTEASQYNMDVSQLNQTINTFNSDLALRPEEGQYNSGNNTIEIYFDNSHNELIHTLAHELGHSLGLQHVQDATSIMYPYTSETIQLSPDDASALTTLCSQHVLVNRLRDNMVFLYQTIQNLAGMVKIKL